MIDIQHLLNNPEIFEKNLISRGNSKSSVGELIEAYTNWKNCQQEVDKIREEKNSFNKEVIKLIGEEKQKAISSMKQTSDKLKEIEEKLRQLKEILATALKKIPNILSDQTPTGNSDEDNPVIKTIGQKPEYNFQPKPYYDLDIYKKYVGDKEGVKAMGSRGYYLKGQMAEFQRALFNYALDKVLANGLELIYVPLLLNEQVLTGTGHLPDFEGQQYEVNIDENKSFYLIGSSEPSIMGYYKDKNLGSLEKPILNTCWSSCFRKEAGSYGKDQQGILRVHQFEKVEMVAIGTKKDCLEFFDKFGSICEDLYSGLGLHYQAVEVCSGDMPTKHYRQIDYNAWFPGTEQYREICSNGNASDYQNRGLNISYTDKNNQKQTPWGLNCTAITFRSGLAILEQFQTVDGRVKLPEVIAQKMNREYLEV